MKKIFAIVAAAALLAGLSSCVKDEIYSYPSVTDINNTIAYDATNTVTVSAKVTALVDVETVTLYWKAGNAEYTAVTMNKSGDTWSGVIPAKPLKTEVTYYIEAKSSTGDVTKSKEIAYVVGDVPVDYTGLRLNELNGNDKFIELFNSSDHDIYMGGVQSLKDEEVHWTAPSVTLKAGEYMLLYSEDVVVGGEAQEGYDPAYVFASGLSAKKNVRVRLVDPKGNTLDDFNCTGHPGTKVPGSYGRNADGKWYVQTATPKAANVDGTDSVESWLTK